jgi:hypothetical protein
MLSHSISNFRTGRNELRRDEQSEAVWAAITADLTEHRGATTREVADRIGLSPAATQARLYELRELGEVRFGPNKHGSRGRTWILGAEDFAARAEQLTPTIIKATQLGIFQRDPLVAALFGDVEARCVSCARPQGSPHADGCVFDGVNIDATHQRDLSNLAAASAPVGG